MSTSIVTSAGIAFDPLDPDPELINVEDLAHHMSNQCRFTGAPREFYSVAQHCVLVADLVAPKFRLWALLHDASEAYLGDLSSPIKVGSRLGEEYTYHEAYLMAAICDRFNIGVHEPLAVKYADRLMFGAEVRDLMPDHPLWGRWREKYDLTSELIDTLPKIQPWSPSYSKHQWLWAIEAETELAREVRL